MAIKFLSERLEMRIRRQALKEGYNLSGDQIRWLFANGAATSGSGGGIKIDWEKAKDKGWMDDFNQNAVKKDKSKSSDKDSSNSKADSVYSDKEIGETEDTLLKYSKSAFKRQPKYSDVLKLRDKDNNVVGVEYSGGDRPGYEDSFTNADKISNDIIKNNPDFEVVLSSMNTNNGKASSLKLLKNKKSGEVLSVSSSQWSGTRIISYKDSKSVNAEYIDRISGYSNKGTSVGKGGSRDRSDSFDYKDAAEEIRKALS